MWNDGKYSNDSEVKRRRQVVEDLVTGDAEALRTMEEEGVSYFMQTLSVNPDFHMEPEGGECVFENKSFRVYKLNR